MKSFGTFLLYIVLPIAIIGAIFWYGFGADLGKKHNLVLKEIYSGDIGVISSQSPPLDKTFTVVNRGKADVIIAKIYTDCKCLSATVPVGEYVFGPFDVPVEQNTKPLDIKIPAGSEMKVKLIFDLTGLPAGKFNGNLYVETLNKEVLDVPIRATIIRQ